jgi:hypothetical protein
MEHRMEGTIRGTLFWVPIIGPLIGGLIGVAVYDFFVGRFLPADAEAGAGEPEAERIAAQEAAA